jgi:hypothetical protein
LKENIALLMPSKHSFAVLDEDFLSFSLPVEPALAILAHSRNIIATIIISLFILHPNN